MKYLVSSKSNQIRNKFIQTLKNKHNIEQDNYFVFDFSTKEDFNNAYMTYMSVDLFNSVKMVVVKNASFLNEHKLDKHIEANFNDILNVETDNIFVFSVEKLNKTKSQYKKLEESFEFLQKEQPKGKELEAFAEKFFNNHKVEFDNSVIPLIVKKVDDNFEYLVNELTKLSLLNTKITVAVANSTIYDYKGESIFELINALVTRNTVKLDLVLKDLREKGTALVSIIEFLVNDLILMNQVKLHGLNTNTEFEQNNQKLAAQMEINPYRLTKLRENGRSYSNKELSYIVEEMVKISSILKSTTIESEEQWITSKFKHMIN